MPRLRYLDRDRVELIAHKLAKQLFSGYGTPLPDFQLLRNEGVAALESALGLPRQPYYRDRFDKAGVLLRSLIKNHPLVDGNKRVGMTATFVFLLSNNRILMASNDEMVEFALKIAAPGPGVSWQEAAAWLRQRSIPATELEDEMRAAIPRLPAEWQGKTALIRRLSDYIEALAKVEL